MNNDEKVFQNRNINWEIKTYGKLRRKAYK